MENLRRKLMANTDFYNPEMMGTSKYGAIPGIEVGTIFDSRKECAEAGVHPRTCAGIAGSIKEGGAYSICLSGVYEDDKDEGDYFIYTGTGGQDDSFGFSGGKQVGDQSFAHRDNATLKISSETKRPVRVVRGANERSEWAPLRGYRYDGLYFVDNAYLDKGKSGYIVCKFELRRLPGQPPIPRNPAYIGNIQSI